MSTLWFRIYKELEKGFENGDYPDGALFATVGSVMEKYGVSAITASRALKELTKGGRLRNVPHKGCVVIGRQRMPKIFLVPPEQLQETALQHADEQKGLFSEAALHGVNVETLSVEDIWKVPKESSGIVIFHHYANFVPTEALVEMLPAHLVPLCMGAYGSQSAYGRGIYLYCDYQRMGLEVIQRFAQQGCGRIGYFGKCFGDCFFPRFKGYMDGLRACGIPFLGTDFFNVDEDGLFDKSKALAWQAAGRFDALYVSNIELCHLLRDAMRAAGVPMTFRLATISAGLRQEPGIDIYTPDFEEMGRQAILMALSPEAAKLFGSDSRLFQTVLWRVRQATIDNP